MWKHIIIFLYNFLPMIYAPTSQLTGNYEHATQPYQILPLVVMKLANDDLDYVTPTDLKENSHVKSSDNTTYSHFTSATSLDDKYLCPAENQEQEKEIERVIDVVKKRDNDLTYVFKLHKHCLLEKTFHKHEPKQCTHEAAPVIAEVYEENLHLNVIQRTVCGPGGNSEMYDFRYEFCASCNLSDGSDLSESKLPFEHIHYIDIYEFCYDHEKKHTLYTYHLIKAPKLLQNDRLQGEREKTFDMMTDGNEYFGSEFEKIRDTYIKSQQASTSEMVTHVYEPQKLVLPDDMAFALWRKPTYHFANTRPMHTELVSLWNYIHKLIRLNAIKTERTFHIYTGAFQTSGQNINELYLFQGQVQIPEIWVTTVYDESFTQGTAVILYNRFDNIQQNYCVTNLGDFSKKPDGDVLRISSIQATRYIQCCKVTPEIQKFFGTNINLDKMTVLDIQIPELNKRKSTISFQSNFFF